MLEMRRADMDHVDGVIQQHFPVILIKAALVAHCQLQPFDAVDIYQRAQGNVGELAQRVHMTTVNRPCAN